MKKTTLVSLSLAGLSIAILGGGPGSEDQRYWRQWRGPAGTGVAPYADPPVEWSESKNVRWKVELPGLGHASPIVCGDRVYIQTAVKTDRKAVVEGDAKKDAEQGGGGHGGRNWMGSVEPTNIHEFMILALDRRTGKTIWQKTLCEKLPHEGGHRDSSKASNSPVTDGEHVFAYFGSRGLYCLNLEGELLWKKDFGAMETRMGFGEGSSPALYGNTVVVNWDHEGESFVVALDKKTGRQRWKIDRDEHTSWATPLIVEHAGKAQVIISATGRVRSYDLESGALIWECGGLTMNVIPTPVSANGLLYLTSGFRGNALLAIRYTDAKGDITDSDAVVWRYDGPGTPYVPSPLLYDDTLYFIDNNKAFLSCVDATSGKTHYIKQRLEGMQGIFASPVGASGRVYIAGRNGTTTVIKRGTKFEKLATNVLDDSFSASPAIADKEIYLRGEKYLYCIARE